jgi:hypothetical protein
MSNLVKFVEAVDTGNRKIIRQKMPPLFENLVSGEATVQQVPHDAGILYRIGVKFGSQALITDVERLKSDHVITEAIDRTKRQIIEAVFGEFRPYFRRLELAIYDYDYETAGKILYEFERQMFELTEKDRKES